MGEQQQLLKGTVKDESSLDQLRQRKGFHKQWKAKKPSSTKVEYQPSLANAVGEANTLVRNALLRRLHVTHVRRKATTVHSLLQECIRVGKWYNDMDAAYLDTVSNSQNAVLLT